MSNLHEISPIRQGVVAAFRDSPFATPGDYRSVSVRPGLSISDILEEVAEACARQAWIDLDGLSHVMRSGR